MSDINTLIPDILALFSREQAPSEENLELFWKELKPSLIESLESNLEIKSELRMSSIGAPDRKLWYNFHSETQQHFKPEHKIKFLFGHILEALLLFFAREAGHSVTDTQKVVEVNGVKGHIDGKIDGVLVDVKSASTFGFQKFASGALLREDPFGYVHQLSGYAEAEGAEEAGFFAIDKQHGKMALLILDGMLLENASDRIDHVKEILADDTPPERCYEPVEQKNGNVKIGFECKHCPHKWTCWETLRAFKYANGTEYYVDLVKEPRVDELTQEEAESSD